MVSRNLLLKRAAREQKIAANCAKTARAWLGVGENVPKHLDTYAATWQKLAASYAYGARLYLFNALERGP